MYIILKHIKTSN